MNFEQAVAKVNTLTKAPSDDCKLKLYSFYKQATVGNNTAACPSFYELKEKAKWKAWKQVDGMPREEAKLRYIALAGELAQ